MGARLSKMLIANRGEIAVRVARAARESGMRTVAVYSGADKGAPHVRVADEAVYIGAAPPRESYLNIEKLVNAAKASGCDCVHPGYGFLSENEDFAQAVKDAGIKFIGPEPEVIRRLGSKTGARAAVRDHGVPLIPGFDDISASPEALAAAAREIGLPVMIKAASGGGGKGMRVVRDPAELPPAIEAARREAQNAFADGAVYVEKFIDHPRHVEIQILADEHGSTVHLFERECSIQRRHQKIVEETPSVALTPALRKAMGDAAVRAAQAVGYTNAGTVEFILGPDGGFYFLEVNTRLQVEHPITEMVTGVDLVKAQIRIANGEKLWFGQDDLAQRGHAIECRLYAEDPENGFLPTPGDVLLWEEPRGFGVRMDAGVVTGMKIPVDYDPILAKLVCWGQDRNEALARMAAALRQTVILGTRTNLQFLHAVVTHPAFVAGETHTGFIPQHLPNWKRPAGAARGLALLVAAALEDKTSPASAKAGLGDGPGDSDRFSPWERLGGFRMGERT
ncbi:MAG: Acetyl-/propionyl-coenzyme A carboxylase alpha chain [Myxococcota bacterium]|nr:Acetyl-/propionyl-coenzyme A carboxylase alpha chain [Myxococcota bacterium]